MITYADRRREVPRKEAMAARRERQNSRTSGFIAVANNEIADKASRLTSTFLVAHPTLTPAEANQQAGEAVAQTLPPVPLGVRTNYKPKTGKDYRRES